MSQFRGLSYAMAGSQNTASTERMHVASNVYVKDGDAGNENAWESYHAEPAEMRKNARKVSVSIRCAALLIGAALTGLFIMILSATAQKTELTKQISKMNEAITVAVRDNYDLNIKVAAARDSARISYKAVQELGMIAPEGAETYYVTAPQTRPNAATLTGNSPSGTTYRASAGSD